jgi:hypothetical protein
MPETPETPAETPETPAEESKEIDWKAEARKHEARAKEYRQKYQEAEPIVSQWKALEEASKTETQRAQEEATRWQTEAQTWRTKAVSSRVETLAADRFADPSDALAAIDPTAYLGVGGDIDEARINADLEALLERKPHWRKTDPTPPGPRVPAPNPAQGSGGNPVSTGPAETFAALIRGRLSGSQ